MSFSAAIPVCFQWRRVVPRRIIDLRGHHGLMNFQSAGVEKSIGIPSSPTRFERARQNKFLRSRQPNR
jgi:hypothetical protein